MGIACRQLLFYYNRILYPNIFILCLQILEDAADFHFKGLELFLTEGMNNFVIWLVKYMFSMFL